MKILQLCNKPPRPTVDGGCLAMDALTNGFLNLGHEVKIVCIQTPKHPFKKNSIDSEYLEKTRFESIYIDTRVNMVDAFSNLLTQDSYNVSRFFSPDCDIRLKKILQREKFDIIQFESLFMTPYLPTIKRNSKAKCILRSHNLEYLIWQRMATGTKNVAKKLYLNHLAKKLELFELDIIKQLDGIVTISREDHQKYASLTPKKNTLINIPFGINLQEYPVETPTQKEPGISLFHLGSLEWQPNLEGVTWFLKEIWPAIRAEFPKLTFYLAGRNIPTEITTEKYPGISVAGEVNDAKEFIRSKSIMLVPILSAGGMRVKIIEGMALGKTILSTSLGAEGIDFEKNKDILIANTKDDFLAHLRKIYASENYLSEQALTSRKFIEKNFDNDKLSYELCQFYSNLLSE